MTTYLYKAEIDNIYDGDTITCTIDCGFGIKLTKQKIRLYGINCPELRGDEKVRGREARDALRNKLHEGKIILKTIKDKKGKYGRWLGIVYLKDENINNWLVKNGYAIETEY